ncbi:MAG TPA: nuclear transport factor 2 family protein [Nocardioidaceae bacterium]|nr:nuclear transport factor 2 family protein [Nocardioidaceae bacterium]
MTTPVLTDGDLIRNLLATYCRLMDGGDFDAVGRLFADASICDENGTVLATGADQVAALYGSTTRRYPDGTPLTQHLVANTHLVESGDDMVATSTYVVLQATPDLALQPIITGTYADTFTRDDEAGWRFTERRIGMGRLGDLSQHLTFPLP